MKLFIDLEIRCRQNVWEGSGPPRDVPSHPPMPYIISESERERKREKNKSTLVKSIGKRQANIRGYDLLEETLRMK
jgi:hypothetical protein